MQPFQECIFMPPLPLKVFVASAGEGGIAAHPHWHSEIEMLYVLEGSAMQQTGDCFYAIEAGDFVFVGENRLHSTYSHKGKQCEILVLQLSLDGFLFQHDWDIYQMVAKACFTHGVKYPQMGKMMHKILSKNEQKGPYKDVFMRGLIYQMLGMLLEKMDSFPLLDQSYATDHQKQFVTSVLAYIDENYHGDITVEKAAKTTHLSVSHFVRQFKAVMGMPFKYYVNFYRVNKSEALLAKGESVTFAAMECGFNNVDSYIRNFKKYKNCTPSVFISNSGKKG